MFDQSNDYLVFHNDLKSQVNGNKSCMNSKQMNNIIGYSEKKKELCRTLEKGSVDFQKLPNESKVPKKE